ncbi:MAG: hypothetical protein JWP43_816 [Ramlibacter sp.]|jgi:hypothetical protein|nr:hypothetical protein [Ramlibacter sp.]
MDERVVKDDELCMMKATRKGESDECFEIWRSGHNVEYRLGNGAVVAEGVLRSY